MYNKELTSFLDFYIVKCNILWTLLHELKTPDLRFHANVGRLSGRQEFETTFISEYQWEWSQKTKCANSLRKQLSVSGTATLTAAKQVYNQHKDTV